MELLYSGFSMFSSNSHDMTFPLLQINMLITFCFLILNDKVSVDLGVVFTINAKERSFFHVICNLLVIE